MICYEYILGGCPEVSEEMVASELQGLCDVVENNIVEGGGIGCGGKDQLIWRVEDMQSNIVVEYDAESKAIIVS